MTKEEILNGMSEEDFYNLYPDQQSWENAQQMKLGGLSGAPHNGQPTAKEFFSYGSPANNAINIPMSNPFYLAYGGSNSGYQTGGIPVQAPDPDEYISNKIDKPYNDYLNARFKKINDYNTKFPMIPAGGGLYKKSSGNSVDRFTYTNGAYVPYTQPVANTNAYGGIPMAQYGVSMTPEDWARQEQENLMNRTGKSLPKNLERISPNRLMYNPFVKNSDITQYDSTHVSPIDPNLAAYFKGNKMIVGPAVKSPEAYKRAADFNKGKIFKGKENFFSEYKAYPNYMQQEGGFIDYTNNTTYPTFSEGGDGYEDGGAIMGLINALTKLKKKAYGGASTQQGGNQNYIENLRSTFDNVISGNVNNALINEAAEEMKTMYKTGGLTQAQMGYNANPSFNYNYDNQVRQDLYKKSLDEKNAAVKDSTNDMLYSGKRNNYYPNYSQGMNYMPMNYGPISKISKKDDAMYRALQKNPSSHLIGYKNTHFGPFGSTKFTFGYKDQDAGPVKLNGQAATPYQGAFYNDNGIPMRTLGPESNPMPTGTTNRSIPMTPGSMMPPAFNIGKQNLMGYGGLYKAQNGMAGWNTTFGNMITPTSGMFPGGPTPAQTTPALAGKPNIVTGSNPAIGTPMSGVSGTEANNTLAPVLSQTTTDLGNATGPEKEVTIKSKQRPNLNPEAVVNWTNAGMNVVSNVLNKAKDKSAEQLSKMQLADNSFIANNQENRGVYDFNSGDFKPDKVLTTKYGGYMQEGGNMQQPDQEQIVQGVAQMLQQGAQPEQIVQQLIQMGLPQEQAMQLIQTVMQNLQGAQEQPTMQYGGGMDEEDEESWEDDLTEDEIAELRNGGYNVQYI